MKIQLCVFKCLRKKEGRLFPLKSAWDSESFGDGRQGLRVEKRKAWKAKHLFRLFPLPKIRHECRLYPDVWHNCFFSSFNMSDRNMTGRGKHKLQEIPLKKKNQKPDIIILHNNSYSHYKAVILSVWTEHKWGEHTTSETLKKYMYIQSQKHHHISRVRLTLIRGWPRFI